MKWLTRPWIMATASAALVIGAAALMMRTPPTQPRPTPSPVEAGDHEIVWLATTNNASSWERFVAAVKRAEGRLQDDLPGAQAQVGDRAFPRQTTAVPEVALTLPGGARLVFRWYKITTDWKTRDWVEALLKRRPPPLAVIGGSSSDAARELAWELQRQSADMPPKERPLLLLTTATADSVADPAAPADAAAAAPNVDLMHIYKERTYRFCFSNRRMAAAVASFLRSQDDLQPDPNSVHMVQWDDDSYSHDLTDGFEQVLRDREGQPVEINPERIQFSVGSFLTPNAFEADSARHVVQDLQRTPGDEPLKADGRGLDAALADLEGKRPRPRPLLIVTGQSAPSRRFLRELARTAPNQARRLVVATGDALSFNTVYRDRLVAWPIQDLPFPLVFFCHYDPIDQDAGFVRGPAGELSAWSTGTEDVLLNSSIVESLALAFDRDRRPAADAAELGKRLLEIRHYRDRLGYATEGAPLFSPDGDRLGGAGENIVCLRPRFDGDRVLPEATIEVWFSRENEPREPDAPPAPVWTRHGEPLTVSYETPVVEKGAGP